MSASVGLNTRSKSLANKLNASSVKSNALRVFADENVYVHPNKRINLASSGEFNFSKKNILKNADFLKNDENVIKAPVVVIESKKLHISNNEKSMNGAPAGELYDVIVLDDSELLCFDSDLMALTGLETACSLTEESSSWADMFSAVEVIRRVTQHHSEIFLTGKEEMFPNALQVAINATSSLRSSTIRNGLFCLRNLALIDVSSVYVVKIIEALMCRTFSSPKFICDISNNIILELIPKIPPMLCIQGAINSTNNKNTEVSSRAFLMISESIIRLFSDINIILLNNNNTQKNEIKLKYDEYIKLLSRGLNARISTSRESSKIALKSMKKYLGDEIFKENLEISLDENSRKEVEREISAEIKIQKQAVIGLQKLQNRPNFKSRFTIPEDQISVPVTVFRVKEKNEKNEICTPTVKLNNFNNDIINNNHDKINNDSNKLSSNSSNNDTIKNVVIAPPRISMKDRIIQQQNEKREQQKELQNNQNDNKDYSQHKANQNESQMSLKMNQKMESKESTSISFIKVKENNCGSGSAVSISVPTSSPSSQLEI